MRSLDDILKSKTIKGDSRRKYEFQAYGNKLADDLHDEKHRALYIKLAKTENRALLEQAREFVIGQNNIKTPGKLFMWKLNELKKQSLQNS